MTDEQAAHLAGMVAELWGVDRGRMWVTVYGASIADLDYDTALNAVVTLFASERFAPTPQQVIHAALGLDDDAAHAAFSATADALNVNGAIDPVCRRAWQDAFGVLAPLSVAPSGRQVDTFIRSWRRRNVAEAKVGRALTEAVDALEVTGG